MFAAYKREISVTVFEMQAKNTLTLHKVYMSEQYQTRQVTHFLSVIVHVILVFSVFKNKNKLLFSAWHYLGPEVTPGTFVMRGPAGFTGAGRGKFGNLSTTLTTNSGSFFWSTYSHLQVRKKKWVIAHEEQALRQEMPYCVFTSIIPSDFVLRNVASMSLH